MFVVGKKKYNRKFFRKYGYKVTEQPTLIKDPEEDKDQEDAYKRAIQGDESDRLILEDYIEQYPHNPRFKSHLYTFFRKNGEDIEAKKIALRTLNQHPDYLFSRLNLADICIQEGNIDMAQKMLGEPRKIETIAPDREIFHISEFLSYQAVSAAYSMEIDDRDAAEKHLELMIDLAPKHHNTKSVAAHIMEKATQMVSKNIEEAKATSITPDNFATYTPEPTKVAPELNHQELEALYLYTEKEFPKEMMDDILQLPRETLIADLENILDDSIRRYKYYHDKYVEFDENEQSFPIHALRFLGALEAHESIQSVLNILRQGEEFLDYWFADMLENYVGDTLLIMGKHQLQALKAYTLEGHQFCLARSYAFETITQIALHDPNRQDEVVQTIKEIFDYHLQHTDDETITSTEFISWSICHATNIRDESLIEYVDKFNEKGWMIEFITGSMENLKKDNQSPPEPADANPIPLNIHEFYNRQHLQRRPKYNRGIEDTLSKTSQKVVKYFIEITAEAMLMSKLEQSGILDIMGELDDEDDDFLYLGYGDKPRIQEYQEPVVREAPKVKRNDPCPCGSGKKYKKCCLKKAS